MVYHVANNIRLSKNVFRFLVVIFLFLCLVFPKSVSAESASIIDNLMAHVADGKEWHLLPFMHPIELTNINFGFIKINVTRHFIMLFIVAFFMCTVLIPAFSGRRILPNKIGLFFEPVVFFVKDTLVLPAMGEELGEKWLPFFYTIFFFLLFSNIAGIIPLFPTVTGNLTITGSLAILIFLAVIIQGMKINGFIGFFKNMIPDGIPKPISVFIFLIELAGLVIRNSVLAIRLFANMIAGHFVILSLLMLMIIVTPYSGIVSVPMALFVDLLEVLVAVIQAVVFTMLAALYIKMASSHE